MDECKVDLNSKKKIILLKLGGSLLTDKNKPFSIREDVVKSAVDQIIEANEKLILIHGGGSFGHPLAKQYSISKGLDKSIPNQIFGVAETHQSMNKFNTYLINQFLEQQYPVLSIQSSSIFIKDFDIILTKSLDVIETALDLDIMPILYGDIILDKQGSFSIISGDQIILELCQNLTNYNVSKVVFAMESDGLYIVDENYKEKCKKCIKKLKNLDFLLYVGETTDRPSFEKIIIEKAVRKYPESIKWLSKLCEELIKSNEYVKAKYICERILKIDPNTANNETVKQVMRRFTNPNVIEIVDDEEFEKLLERKNKGEYVDDLIKQNRYTAKVLKVESDREHEEWYKSTRRMVQKQEVRLMKEIITPAEKLKKLNELRGDARLITKFMETLDNERITLEELLKYDEDYKTLLERKNAGEPVEDLIKQNRYQAEILAKKDNENIDEIYDITSIIGNELKRNEEEYEKLLERKNKGDYIDDLINQNHNTDLKPCSFSLSV